MQIAVNPPPRWAFEVDREASTRDGRRVRFRVFAPRLPWRYPRRARAPRSYTECGGPKLFHDLFSDPQGLAEAVRKMCGPKKTAREFDAGGPEAGTLSGARRAAGLFDENWAREFPLTRRERAALAAGETAPDPFFQPPTSPAPENWIEDKLTRLRGTFGPTKYQTPKGWLPFCPEGGFSVSCAGPDGEVGWTGGSEPLTALDIARFKDAYCAPGQCQTPGVATPPAGYHEFSIKLKPKNPAVALKASCQPVPAVEPVVMDVPLPPLPGPPPPPGVPAGALTGGCPAGMYWTISSIGLRCGTVPPQLRVATAEDLAYFGGGG